MSTEPDRSESRSFDQQKKREELARILGSLPSASREDARPELERILGGLERVDVGALRSKASLTSEQLGARRKFLEERKANTGAPAEFVEVRVALVEQLDRPNMRASVVRRPGDGGRPLLLLSEVGVTPEDLRAGLRAAAVSVKVHGPSPARETRQTVRVKKGGSSRAAAGSVVALLELLKSRPAQNVEGVGIVKSLEILTKPVRPR